ncbi:MAG: hypothetical protein AB1640_09385 [bacterium]
MAAVSPQDELVHRDYPRSADKAWKENWYFNFIDRQHNAWGINHISLERHKQSGRFSAFHVVDGEILVYLNHVPVGEDFSDLTDGKLRVELVEPHRQFRLSFAGPNHSVDLTCLARFEVFDYAAPGEKTLEGDKKAISIRHYEQALTVSGTLTKGGVSRPIACFGHRDHSWGYRDESNIAGWNWIAVQFPDRTINVSRVCVPGMSPMSRGFVSERGGNTGIRQVRIVSTERGEDGVPVSSTFEAVDEKGRPWTLTSRRFSGLVLPLSEKGRQVVVYENFADYALAQTGEQGLGIDEYLENTAVG